MPDLSSSLRDLVNGSTRPIDVDAIVGARRRRRLRRRVAVGTAVVVIAAVVTGSVLARPVHEPNAVAVGGSGGSHPVSESEATRSALAGLTIVSPDKSTQLGVDLARGSVDLTDPGSGASRQVPFPVPGMDSSPPFVAGSNVVMVLEPLASDSLVPDGSAYVMSSGFDRWRSIGAASSVIMSLDAGRVWRVTASNVAEVSLADATSSRSYPLTDQRKPLAAVTGGLLTTRPGPPNSGQEILELWDPATNRVVRRFPADAALVAASGNDVVWDACAKACVRHVLDVRTGRDQRLAVPAGMSWGTEAARSPDGRYLALVAHSPLTRAEGESQNLSPPSGTHASVISVIDLSTGKQADRRVTTWKGATPVAWSPDGSVVFFARTQSDVDYFNTTYARSPLHDLAVTGATGFLVAALPAPTTETQRYEYDGLISQSVQHSAEMCVYATADDEIGGGYDGCAGPQIAGWDWSKVKGKKAAGGVISGNFRVVGTYDGEVFTMTQAPTASHPSRPAPLPSFKTTCPAPAGGWHVTNPARMTFDDYNALTSTARDAPDFAGIWIDSSTAPSSDTNDFARDVFNIAFTGNLDGHRRQLAAVWGGPICVVRHPRSMNQLEAVARELFGSAGKQLGLQMLGGGPDDLHDVVVARAIAVSPATQRAIEQRFGKGVVDMSSALRPIG